MKLFSKKQFAGLIARLHVRITPVTLVFLLLGASTVQANTLRDISFFALPGNKVQVVLTLDEPVEKPSSFSTDNPARVAIDLAETSSALEKKSQTIGIGMARSVTAVEADNKTRVVLNLVSAVNHTVKSEGNKIVVDIGGGSGSGTSTTSKQITASDTGISGTAPASAVKAIDFRRGEKGKAEVIVMLSNEDAVVDMRTEGGKLVLEVLDSKLDADLSRQLDVSDFATPVQSIETRQQGNNVLIKVDATGDYDHLAYQLNDSYVLEVRPMTKKEVEQAKLEKRIFTGDRLSLNFQDIEVRSVLQLLADFTGLNMVVSDTVTGNVTLRLKNVPWDQAMDIILRTKGLSMRQTDNVVLIAPTQEITNWEKNELEAKKEIQELAPLRSELVQINYAKAADMTALLKQEGNRLLSERGNVTVDVRTNSILIQDTADKLEEIRSLLTKLDIPVRQVMIESRIVSATDNFSKDLGVRLGLAQDKPWKVGNNEQFSVSGSRPGTIDLNGNTTSNMLVDLGIAGASGGVDFVLAKLGQHILSLELEAMQAEDKGEIISNPRVITADKSTAIIKEGVEIAYVSSDGDSVNTEFKEAVLKLEVTPQITPDDRVLMELSITKDAATTVAESDEPAIAKQEIETTVLVDNGETVVLGGVFEKTTTTASEKVPVLGDLPMLGFFFRNSGKVEDNRELLIFVTPKIVKESLKLQ
jgi:type IV pilus assembly protein PilQ